MGPLGKFIRCFESITSVDIQLVGGKNASLGEMINTLAKEDIQVPDGFAVTSDAYWDFLDANRLRDRIEMVMAAFKKGDMPLEEAGRTIRKMINASIFPSYLAEEIRSAYRLLSRQFGLIEADVAVRSSATAEDLSEASFAGQLESYLNVLGEEELLTACKKCYASLFTDRAIAYREKNRFDHLKVALSIGVQKMIKAETTGSGVMFTLDTETGFPDVIVINASWGLGEYVVKGMVNPDQYMVFKPLLGKDSYHPIIEKTLGDKDKKLIYSTGGSQSTEGIPTTIQEQNAFVLDDKEILGLAEWGKKIEQHYGKAMDIEWIKEEDTGHFYILQARPETVHSQKEELKIRSYRLREKKRRIISGLGIGSAVVSGKIHHVRNIKDLANIDSGTIIVTEMTEPDWVGAMSNITGIITDFGGRTCHAAIVSRELGIPAIVGTQNATERMIEGQMVTLSCAEGEIGNVYEGVVGYEVKEIQINKLPRTNTQIMMNMAAPEGSMKWWRLPADGIGLARIEFIITQHIKIHPMALLHYNKIKDEFIRKEIRRKTHGYANRGDYFVDFLSREISKIAATRYPKPVIVRTSDFKTNEYAGLIGGIYFEPEEANPMLGWRGASRYYSEGYREGFALECAAIKKAREDIGLTNIVVMIPFCRSINEAERVLDEMASNGLKRQENGLKVYMMCEIPSNVILAEDFARYFDGFSIGSNDLTQLILGVDRDSAILSDLFDENNMAVRSAIHDYIKRMHVVNKPVSICGQAPSDKPDFVDFLVDAGIDAISVNPDSVIDIIMRVSDVEKKQRDQHAPIEKQH